MSNSSSKPPLPAQSQEAHPDFNWPPSDEELAYCFNEATSGEKLAQSGVESGLQGTVPEETLPKETLPKETLPEEALLEAGIEDSITPGLAVATYEPAVAVDVVSGGTWAAEISQLQALLAALTEKVEWRVTNRLRR